MLQKKGQVTFFIIIGILLLISVTLVLYFGTEKITKTIGEARDVPLEFKSIHTFVQQCLEETSLRSVLLLGTQGGFIDVPARISTNPKAVISLTPSGDLSLPLWYFAGETRMPTVAFMEQELSNVITRQMETCLKGLNDPAFTNQFTFLFPKTMTTDVRIDNRAVFVQFSYPLTVAKEEERFSFTTFSTRLDVKLGKMFELAKDIFYAEDHTLFLEDLTLELMTAGSGRPPDDVPFTDIQFTCDKPQWSRKAVLNTVQNRLYHNLPRIRVANTATPQIPREDRYGKGHFEWKATDKNYNDIDVGVTFRKDGPFDFIVTPSVGDVMPASFGKGGREYLRYMCINAYHFTYTLSYPLMFTLIDHKALDGDGYVFRFALPVLIDHNKGERRNIDQSIFTVLERDRDVCGELEETPFTVYAFDNETGTYINGANVSFDCVNLFNCPLGRTTQVGGIARLASLLPTFCAPGSIVVEHQDYVTTKQQLDRSADSVDVNLLPVRHVPLTVVKRTLTGNQVNKEESLYSGEKALVFLTTDDVREFSSTTRFPFNKNTDDLDELTNEEAQRLGSIDVINADGITYDLTIALLNDKDDLIGRIETNWTPTKSDVEAATGAVLTVFEYVPHPTATIAQAKMIEETQKPTYTRQAAPRFVSTT